MISAREPRLGPQFTASRDAIAASCAPWLLRPQLDGDLFTNFFSSSRYIRAALAHDVLRGTVVASSHVFDPPCQAQHRATGL
ncbi:hypothetical protein B8W66_06955 [Mycobacterium decipiens]|uniref:Uncharacterized protein n=1 Tax=Mycobacterium decipiens TaxID=1430326 RepID=A0A1X2LYT3_9MYCO|nr:hypothetical protein B8W66_06955 [Mycobacterium decipiens]